MKIISKIALIITCFIFISCDKIMNSDNFIGKWELAKSGNELIALSGSEFELVIEKKDQFYIAKYKTKVNNKVIDYYELLNKDVKDSLQKNTVENMFRYTLANDNLLVNVLEPIKNNILYNEKEGLIIFQGMWLSRKQ